MNPDSTTMNRRHLIKCLTLSAAGPIGLCNSATGTAPLTRLQVGSFSVCVPAKWLKSVLCEHVPLKALYSKAGWKEYQANKHFKLKPNYGCRPEHWAVRLPSSLPAGMKFDPKTAGESELAPQILIHKSSQWDVSFTDGFENTLSSDQLHETMRKNMDELFARDKANPGPAFMDAGLAFQSLKRRINFQGGYGIRMVAQWTIEPELIRSGLLHYYFLGMSDDSSCQIIATFPLSAKDLPVAEQKAHLGWSTEDYDQFSKSFDRYESAAKHWVADHELLFNPSIEELDTMMQSLVAERWLD